MVLFNELTVYRREKQRQSARVKASAVLYFRALIYSGCEFRNRAKRDNKTGGTRKTGSVRFFCPKLRRNGMRAEYITVFSDSSEAICLFVF